MKTVSSHRLQLIDDLDSAVEEFLDVCQKIKLSTPAYEDGWGVKGIIAHIVFWHEYYAQVITAYSNNRKPELLWNLKLANDEGCPKLTKRPRNELIERMRLAHSKLRENIIKLDKLDIKYYAKGSRTYTVEEYLSLIDGHIRKHSLDLNRAQKRALKKQS